MRQSYRAKQSRKARINREKEQKSVEKKNKQGYNKNSYRNNRSFNESERRSKEQEKDYEDIVSGRNAVLELLKSDKDINKLYIERGEKHGSINEIIAKANEKKVVIVEVSKQKLDSLAEFHQGVVAVVPPFNYCEPEDILDYAKEKDEEPFIIILDGIEDVHNLGAIIRTAETAGCHGVIIPKRRTVTVNSTVSKVSAGATSYVKVARVNNLNETIRMLKEQGLWIIGTDGDAEKYYYDQDFKGPIAIVIGSEGNGMGRLTKENVDLLVKIPMNGKITSLNASVSAGIVIYEAVKQRK